MVESYIWYYGEQLWSWEYANLCVLFYRLGESVNRALLNHLLKMFTALGIYSDNFEKPFLEFTSEFYAAEGMKYMQQSDVPDYLKHVEVVMALFSSLFYTFSEYLFILCIFLCPLTVSLYLCFYFIFLWSFEIK